VLVPELSPGDVVGMDNLSCHTQLAVRGLIEAAAVCWTCHRAARI
jgi:hypothetical protein